MGEIYKIPSWAKGVLDVLLDQPLKITNVVLPTGNCPTVTGNCHTDFESAYGNIYRINTDPSTEQIMQCKSTSSLTIGCSTHSQARMGISWIIGWV